jgi:hypothetical protein
MRWSRALVTIALGRRNSTKTRHKIAYTLAESIDAPICVVHSRET